MIPTRFQLHQAARIIKAGGVLAYPTEAIFGFGCDPDDGGAVERILAIKGRSATKGLILIAAAIEQILPFIAELPKLRAAEIRASWPGPTTWVLPATPKTPLWLTGGRTTIAARVTAHRGTADLCRACGMALVSTSANRSGRRPTRSSLTVRRWFKTDIDYLLPGACGAERRPSRMIDANSGEVLR